MPDNSGNLGGDTLVGYRLKQIELALDSHMKKEDQTLVRIHERLDASLTALADFTQAVGDVRHELDEEIAKVREEIAKVSKECSEARAAIAKDLHDVGLKVAYLSGKTAMWGALAGGAIALIIAVIQVLLT